MTRHIEVKTPGRLHCGLTSFGHHDSRQYGGLGLMLENVGISLTLAAAPSFQVQGPLHERVESFAHNLAGHLQLDTLPACQVEVTAAIPQHVGLGVGTQLGLAVVAGLAEWLNIAWRDPAQLATLSGRGRRSAIGTHGFLQGGLLADAGKLAAEPLGELADRVALPADWRFVLIRSPAASGLAGPAENQAISQLPPVPTSVTAELERLIHQGILPAARASDWQAFSEAIYSYGYQAGECFAPAQGGPFATPEIATTVDQIRALGVPGVGQSSWGPTVFAVTPDAAGADQLVQQLKAEPRYRDYSFDIAAPNNRGVAMTVQAS